MLVAHHGSIWLRRFCAKHGETESLYEESAELWRARAGWNTPTLAITPDRVDNYRAAPGSYADGLPASHGQHTCILLLNITDRCNYGCTTCYASAKTPGTPVSPLERPTREDILFTVQTVLTRENGKLGVLMLSGGEPTVRDDLPEIIAELVELNITRVVINTNGRRIARDDRFVEFLRGHRSRIEVYLQFDGVQANTSRLLRNEDVVAEKLEALRRLDAAGIYTTLVATVQRGVNEEEIGDLVRIGLDTPHCAGLALQPVFGSGRTVSIDPRNRTTPTGLLARMKERTGGIIEGSDFIPLPCSHRDCCDIGYLIRTADGQWKPLLKLLGADELKKWIHLVSNTISFDGVSQDVAAMLKSGALQRIFSEQLPIGMPALAKDIGWMCDCIPGLPELLSGIGARIGRKENMLELAAQRTFRITIKMFMDAHTFHAARLRQCCVHTGTFETDPRRYSFCWRWLFADALDFPEPGFIPMRTLK